MRVEWHVDPEAQIIKLKARVERLTADNERLKARVEEYKNGYKGACYCCEPVGELNLKLQAVRNAAKDWLLEAQTEQEAEDAGRRLETLLAAIEQEEDDE